MRKSRDYSKPLLVAEVKPQSPFSAKPAGDWEELFRMANAIGDVISIHTDPRWGGNGVELIKRARQMTNKNILAKGIHSSDAMVEQLLDAGADVVLTVGYVSTKHLIQTWAEPTSFKELLEWADVFKGTAARFVWNARDLVTGQRKIETFEEARQAWNGWLCQASFIGNWADVNPEAEAFIVGESLPRFHQLCSRLGGIPTELSEMEVLPHEQVVNTQKMLTYPEGLSPERLTAGYTVPWRP